MNHLIFGAVNRVLHPAANPPAKGGSIAALLGYTGPFRPALANPIPKEELIKMGEEMLADIAAENKKNEQVKRRKQERF